MKDIETIQVEYVAFEYSTLTTASQYRKIVAENGIPDEIYLTKNDNKRYHFMKTNYHLESDTLYSKGKLLVDREELENKKNALSDIAVIEAENKLVYNIYSRYSHYEYYYIYRCNCVFSPVAKLIIIKIRKGYLIIAI